MAFIIGDRVVRTSYSIARIKPGHLGTVVSVSPNIVKIKWDNNSNIMHYGASVANQYIQLSKETKEMGTTKATQTAPKKIEAEGTQDIDQAAKTIAIAEIVHFGDKITLPARMSLRQAVEQLERREKYLEEEMTMVEVFDVFPWDGAVALNNCLKTKYGWASAEPTPGFFGPTPPKLISIDIGPNEVVSVPWGRFSLPGVDGFIQSGVGKKNDRMAFSIAAAIKRKDEAVVRDLFERVKNELMHNSIYRGKAIKIRFLDDDGETLSMPEPKFIDTTTIKEENLIYSQDVMDMVETSLFTPIRRIKELAANGIPVKRGVMLGGTFGTGKTLAAFVASKLAVEQGMTYIYVPRANELPEAIEFAKQYQTVGAVIFCEDIDRVADGGRTVEMDDILNLIDGIDTKTSKIMIVLTTNSLETLNPALLRPGRLDAVINVTPPDAAAVERLIKFYGNDTLDPAADLKPVGQLLAGSIPAVIAEVVKRAKLAQLRRQPEGTKVSKISSEALIESATSMQSQLDLLKRRIDDSSTRPSLTSTFKEAVQEAVKEAHDLNNRQVAEIHRHVT